VSSKRRVEGGSLTVIEGVLVSCDLVLNFVKASLYTRGQNLSVVHYSQE
jgi:hypothetical protein